MRILFLTIMLPGLRRTGGEIATQSFIDAARHAGHDVAVLGYRRIGTDPPMQPGDHVVADWHIETEGAGLRPLAWMARAVATGRPYTTTKFVSRAYREAVRRQLAEHRPDLIVMDQARHAWLLPREGWDVPFVLNTQNVEHELYERLAADTKGLRRFAERREAGRIRAVEERLCREAAEVWALTRHDAAALAALGGRTRHFEIPATGIAPAPPAPAFDVAILGGWHWRANAAGLRWFADEVFPHLRDRGLDVRVGGASGQEVAGGREGLTIVGPVPDALEFLQSARVVAVPSVSGAGIQVKTLDALASGRRVVATTVAMRGIDDPPPTGSVADEPEAFADALAAAAGAGDDEETAAVARAWAVERRDRFRARVAEAVSALAT